MAPKAREEVARRPDVSRIEKTNKVPTWQYLPIQQFAQVLNHHSEGTNDMYLGRLNFSDFATAAVHL